MAKTVITHTNKEGKPVVDENIQMKGIDKYTDYSVVMPKGVEDYNIYILSDVYINSRDNKVQLEKLGADIEIIRKDPNAIVVVNGNWFWFDNAVFGFDKGKLIPEAFLEHIEYSDEVKGIVQGFVAKDRELREKLLKIDKEDAEEVAKLKEEYAFAESDWANLSEEAQFAWCVEKMKDGEAEIKQEKARHKEAYEKQKQEYNHAELKYRFDMKIYKQDLSAYNKKLATNKNVENLVKPVEPTAPDVKQKPAPYEEPNLMNPFLKNEIYTKNKQQIKMLLQRQAYRPYIKDVTKLLTPIKEKIAVINYGNEEEKIFNYRQYNPMFQVAKKLEKEQAYSDNVFWMLHVTLQNELIDNQKMTNTFAGTYGIGNANFLTSVQSKGKTIFNSFKGLDGYLVSGYETNAYERGMGFYTDQFGNLIMKPNVTFYAAGYRKVPETNKVRLKSYVVERELNSSFAHFSMIKSPAYNSNKLVDKEGKLIEFDEEYYNNLQQLVEGEANAKAGKQYDLEAPKSLPYKLTFSHEQMRSPSKLIEQAKGSVARQKLMAFAKIDMQQSFRAQAKAMYEAVMFDKKDEIKELVLEPNKE